MWGGRDVRRIISKIEEEGDTLQTAVLFEVTREESGRFQVDTHGGEDDGEVLLVVIVHTLVRSPLLLDQASLSTDLSGNLVVRQTSGGEDGDLLSTSDRVHGVDGRDTGGYHFFGVHL